MNVAVGEKVRVRIPNWEKTHAGWVEHPTEHDVEVTGVGEGYIEFKNWWSDGHSVLPKRQIVSAPTTEEDNRG